MEAGGGRSGGGGGDGDGGGGDAGYAGEKLVGDPADQSLAKLGGGPAPDDRDSNAKGCENMKDFTTVHDLKKTIRPFQAQLAQIEVQISSKTSKQLKVQENTILKQRDLQINDHHSEFWPRVLSLSPGLKERYLGADKQMFQEVTNVQVTETDSSLSIQIDVKDNEYFENKVFFKFYPLGDRTDQVLGTKVIWKPEMNPSGWLNHRKSFFEWFSDATPFRDDLIGQEIVKLYKEPLQDVLSDEDDWIGKDTKLLQDDLPDVDGMGNEEAEQVHGLNDYQKINGSPRDDTVCGQDEFPTL